MASSVPDRILRSRCKQHGECLCNDELTSEAHRRRHGSSGQQASSSRCRPLGAALMAAVSAVVTPAMALLSTGSQLEPSQQVMTTATMSHHEAGSASRRTLAQATPPLQISEVTSNPARQRTVRPLARAGGTGARRLSLWAAAIAAVGCAIVLAVVYRHAVLSGSGAAAQMAGAQLANAYAMSTATLWAWYHGMESYLALHAHTAEASAPSAAQASSVRELREALARLEQVVAGVASRSADKARLDVDSLAGVIAAKLAGAAKADREAAQGELARLKADLAGLRDSAGTRHSDTAKQVERLAQLVDSLRLSASAAGSAGSSSAPSSEADQLPDYALLSGGARVESTRDTRAHVGWASPWRRLLWFWWQRAGPEAALTAAVQPGLCWPFVGFPGRLAVRLSHPIRVSGVSIDHLPRRQSYNDSVASAPRSFSVYGLTDACAGLDAAVKLGTFAYDAEAGPPTQTFRLARASAERYPFVELVVHSNHGSADYTCLYRFRVHGHMS